MRRESVVEVAQDGQESPTGEPRACRGRCCAYRQSVDRRYLQKYSQWARDAARPAKPRLTFSLWPSVVVLPLAYMVE